jgi:hypothetical protein
MVALVGRLYWFEAVDDPALAALVSVVLQPVIIFTPAVLGKRIEAAEPEIGVDCEQIHLHMNRSHGSLDGSLQEELVQESCHLGGRVGDLQLADTLERRARQLLEPTEQTCLGFSIELAIQERADFANEAITGLPACCRSWQCRG